MADARHSIRKETLQVSVDSEPLALAVRPRLERINRTVFLPILERVFGEFAGPDAHIRIDHLQIDLGTVAAADLERVAPARFERELRDRLHHLIHRRHAETSGRATVRSPEASRLEAVEHYLLTGTLPFWASPGAFSLDEAVTAIVEGSPAALVALFRRRGSNDRVLQRTALRLSEATLRRLLPVLAPEDAATIVMYIVEIRRCHAVQPLIPASDEKLGRILWVVALTYVVRDPGTQFNRKSMVQSLLRGIAVAERLTYADILSLFDVGLIATDHRLPVDVTLLETVASLIDDERRVNPWFVGAGQMSGQRAPAPSPAWPVPSFFKYEQVEALRYYLRHGVLPWHATLRRPAPTVGDLLRQLPALPISLLRALAAGLPEEDQVRGWHRIVRGLAEETLARLLTSMASQVNPDASAMLAAIDARARLCPDRTLFYSCVIAALLDDREEAAESGWINAVAPTEFAIDAPWEPHWIKSVLAIRAAAGAGPAAGEPSSAALLLALVQASPDEAKYWLGALRAAGVRPSVLADEPTAARSIALAEALLPASAIAVSILLEALAAFPEADRPGPAERVSAIILQEILDQNPAGSAGDLLTRLLSRLFGARASHRTLDVVVATIDRLAASGRISAFSAQGLTATVRGTAVDHGGKAPPSTSDAPASADARTFDSTEAVLEWLQRFRSAPSVDASPVPGEDDLRHIFRQALDRSPQRISDLLHESLHDARARRQWVATLSESELAQVAACLEPRHARALLDGAERLFSAWVLVTRSRTGGERRSFWLFVFEFLAGTRDHDRSLEQLTRAFVAHFDKRTSADPEGSPGETGLFPERLLQTAARLADNAGDAALSAALSKQRALLEPSAAAAASASAAETPAPRPGDARHPSEARPPAPAIPIGSSDRTEPRRRTAFSLDDDRLPGESEPIYITNAGLVLTAPFLPRLFSALDMIERDGAGRSRIRPELLSRAVHLLQWIVDGRTSTPEPLLCLNKLLCGAAFAVPVDASIKPTQREIEMGTALLTSVVANWTIISNTSVAGLQETFLQREGRLERVASGWRLEVQRKTVDVLLDHLPWSLSTIVHSLMAEPIFVKW